MAINPVDNARLTERPAQMIDDNRNVLPAAIAAIVDGTGEIVGYLPLKATDNADGTATLNVKVDGIILDPDIDIGDVHLLNLVDARINPATEDKQDDIITAINGIASTDPIGLKNAALTTINPATEEKQDSIITQLTTEVRALFDSLGNAITSTLVSAKRGVDVFIVNDESLPVIVQNAEGNFAANGDMYEFATDQTNFTPSATEHSFILIRNPGGSGKQLRIRKIAQSIVSTNKPTTFRIYLNPTITANGSAEFPVNKLSGSSNTPVALVTSLPTISANGNRVAATVPVAGVFTISEDFTLIISEGDSVLITVEPTVNNTEVNLTMDWAEVTV